MLKQLKQETAALHREVEQDNLARFIMDGSITLEQYDSLLRQNFIVYKGVEDFVNARYEQLPEDLQSFAGYEKTNNLAKDILAISSLPLPTALQVVGARNLATIIGKLYVIEGSMIGGMMMAKKLSECKKISQVRQHHFYNSNSSINASRWKEFKEAVNGQSFTYDDVEKAIISAKETFLLFQKAYLVEYL